MSIRKLKIHFIGIGGIGVSALAQYYLAKDHQVSGSDLVSSEIIDSLKKKGVKIHLGQHQAENLPKDADLVIYSPAVKSDNPELRQAKKIKYQSYPEALGELTKQYFTIAVSGTHGKSTTSAMIGLLLTKAGLDPTVIVGTKVKEFGNSNFRAGKSKYLIIEADEHFGSFLHYWPKIIVLTNIEKDHLDYYKNLKNLKKAFKEYISHLPKDGLLITGKPTDQKDAQKLKDILKIPGKHNIENAFLALLTGRALKIPDRISFGALSQFRGTWRRFEVISKNPIVISDYAHHPTEIKATLRAVREKWPRKEIWCIFQPHQYQRTFYLFKDFVDVFKKSPIDKVVLIDIYDVAGREEKEIKKRVSSEKIVKAVNNSKVTYLPREKVVDYIKKNLPTSGIVIIMGAGDIYQLVSFFHK